MAGRRTWTSGGRRRGAGADLAALTRRWRSSPPRVPGTRGTPRRRSGPGLRLCHPHRSRGPGTRGALVDGEVRPLRSVLRSGQRVEILTADDVRPSCERMDWVRPRAGLALRRAIRRAEQGVPSWPRRRRFSATASGGWTPPRRQGTEVRGCSVPSVLGERRLAARSTPAGSPTTSCSPASPPPARAALDALLAELAREGVVDTSKIEVRQALSDEASIRSWIQRTLVERLHRRAFPEAPVSIAVCGTPVGATRGVLPSRVRGRPRHPSSPKRGPPSTAGAAGRCVRWSSTTPPGWRGRAGRTLPGGSSRTCASGAATGGVCCRR